MLFVIIGISAIFTEPMPGIISLLIGILILPLTSILLTNKFNIKLNWKVKAGLVIILFIAFGASIDYSQRAKENRTAEEKTTKEKHRIEQEQQRIYEYYYNNRDSIITELSSYINIANYQGAIIMSNEYQFIKDSTISGIRSIAFKAMKAHKDSIRVKELLERISDTDDKMYSLNTDLYGELVQLCPENQKYKEKYNYYLTRRNNLNLIENQNSEIKRIASNEFNDDLIKAIMESENNMTWVSIDYRITVSWDEKDFVRTSAINAKLIAPKIFNFSNVDALEIRTFTEFKDVYGNVSEDVGIKFMISKNVADKIKWGNFDPRNFQYVLNDDYSGMYIHPPLINAWHQYVNNF